MTENDYCLLYDIASKRVTELETENNKLLDVINNQDVKIADLENENKKLDRALITSTKNNIERQKIIDSLQAEKEKEKVQIIAKCSDREEGLRRKIFKLEEQIEEMKLCANCKWLPMINETITACQKCNNKNKWELREKKEND